MFQMKRKRARENTQFSVAVPARVYKIKKYRDGERLSRWGQEAMNRKAERLSQSLENLIVFVF